MHMTRQLKLTAKDKTFSIKIESGTIMKIIPPDCECLGI